jgi:hypothetical protein
MWAVVVWFAGAVACMPSVASWISHATPRAIVDSRIKFIKRGSSNALTWSVLVWCEGGVR